MNLYKQLRLLLLLLLGVIVSCEKEIKDRPERPEPTEDEEIRASIYDYFNKYSLWTDQIPDRDEEERLAFVEQYTSNNGVLNALKGLTPFYKGYDGSIDRFSFLDESDADGNVSRSDGMRMDTNDGYGLYFGWGILSPNAKEAYPVIFFVEGGSPAQKAGVTRGTIVYALNDEEITVGLTSTGRLDEAQQQRMEHKLNAALEAKSLTLDTETADGEDEVYTLSYKTYDIDPIVADTIYKASKNVGYLAYSSFEEVDDSAKGKGNRNKLDAIITSFEKAGIKDLILDLRYNTGGYVETAEYMANKLINSAHDDKLMFTYDVNDYLKRHFKKDFQDTYFSRDNALDLKNIYVLVTESTASAAELLINVLKPHLSVTLIAETDRTYGKPVGFFPEDINDDVTLWVTSFKTINADGDTDYWDGMAADSIGVTDYIFRDFGDPQEMMIAKALETAGISPARGLRASSQKTYSSQRGVKLGIINKPRERNMLKTKE